jgi:hypothetical protein
VLSKDFYSKFRIAAATIPNICAGCQILKYKEHQKGKLKMRDSLPKATPEDQLNQ